MCNFSFGPHPLHWSVFYDAPEDGYVGDFWDMVANPAHPMPGAWELDEQHAYQLSEGASYEVHRGRPQYRRFGVKRKVLRRIDAEMKIAERNLTDPPYESGEVSRLSELVAYFASFAERYQSGWRPVPGCGGEGDRIWELRKSLGTLPIPVC